MLSKVQRIFCLFVVISFNWNNTICQDIAYNNLDTDSKRSKSRYDSTYFTTTPQIEVIGSPSKLDQIPGSAAIITSAEISKVNPISGNEVLRKVSGINVVDEEGVGMRANIGIRGLDPDRSKGVLMLEDGVPVALMPYGEPEMYYTPAIDRMNGIEVLKGSGSILFGPNTIGGVINYLTAEPPKESLTSLKVRGGQGGIFTSNLGYGTSIDNMGMQVNFLRKSADKIGITNFAINDFTGKFKLDLSNSSSIGLKIGIYDESSNSTYVGINQAMFESGSYDFEHPSPNDVLNLRRYSASLTHQYKLSSNFELKTNVYGYTTTRDWSRQDYDTKFNSSTNYNRVFGDSSVTDGALFFKNTTGNRNRQFEVFGVEPRLKGNFTTGSIVHQIDIGARYVFERVFDKRINGNIINRYSGNLASDEMRTGNALSAFIQDRIFLDENLIITPGIRFENYDFERNILRASSKDTNIISQSNVAIFIPGIGVSYKIGDGSSIFAGIHRGFAPPLITSAISSAGVDQQLDGQYSWNYELGMRNNSLNWFFIDLTAFYMDFSNAVIPVSESAGGVGRYAGIVEVNAGRTKHVGVELGTTFIFSKMMTTDYNIALNFNATFMQATFNDDRFIISNSATINVLNNDLPYAPQLLLSGSFDFDTPFGLMSRFNVTYVGSQFTDEINSINPTANGRTGQMPSYFVLDCNISYFIDAINSTVNFNIKNLLDERYIASRRPEGIRLGLPRLVTFGLEYNLNN